MFALMEDSAGVELIDVRTGAEYREVHAEGARLVPLDQLNVQAVAGGHKDMAKPFYLICKSGGRARQAAERFRLAGVQNVIVVEGGTAAWEAAGLPVMRGKKTISLERQVRIAAGFLVLIGVSLGFAVHPAFFGLCAFVGAGLMFAGVTGWCGMGMLLVKMPWNRVGAQPLGGQTCCGS